MDAKLTPAPWVVLIGKPSVDVDGAHHCQVGLDFYTSLNDGTTVATGYRNMPGSPEHEYLSMSGICRPADAVAMAAAGEMLAALKALELAANTVRGCYDRNPANFAMALQDLGDQAANARAAITKATTIPAVSAPPATPDGAA